MKKRYLKPEMEVTELLGIDTICHASIYASDGTTPEDVIQDEDDKGWTTKPEPGKSIWID